MEMKAPLITDFKKGLRYLSLDIRVVLVEPIYQGNIGSVARAMKNFGYTNLVLVNPCKLEGEARAMASHARDILEGALVTSSFDVWGRYAMAMRLRNSNRLIL